ncbi:DUF58 domain-containing protein [Brachybacterium timonense]|uniref:DUF58 domain-containing protein n=1 Tax=Brachybacterium timonense TaxID=2050896 RepID=UPI000D0B58C6|nr:DUF58 domain-containing protein [Brachybacterium timonense]
MTTAPAGENTATTSTRLTPTLRGTLLGALALALWLLGDLFALAVPRALAAALLAALLLGLLAMLLARLGLRLDRAVVDDVIPHGERVRVQMNLAPRALLAHLALGRGAVREHLPDALGGTGDLALAPAMPHTLPTIRRGHHSLAPATIIVRDVLGLWQLRHRTLDHAAVTVLPERETVGPTAARTAHIDRGDAAPSHAHTGIGEIGPIARPYASGDDIRRIHWRASARTGRLMTREDEAPTARTATILLDTRPGADGPADLALEDRLVSIVASLLESLSAHGWEVRVLDATGDELTRTPARRGASGSAVGGEADAIASRAAQRALAVVGFDDPDAAGDGRSDHGAAQTALALAVGRAEPAPFDGLDLDRHAGRATARTAIALRSGEGHRSGSHPVDHPATTLRSGGGQADDAEAAGRGRRRRGLPAARRGVHRRSAPAGPTRDRADPTGGITTGRRGAWTVVTGDLEDSLDDLLSAAAPNAVAGAAPGAASSGASGVARSSAPGRTQGAAPNGAPR